MAGLKPNCVVIVATVRALKYNGGIPYGDELQKENLEALEAVLSDATAAGADAFACLGDIVGYGADPNACCERVRALGCPVVQGNHDHAAGGRYSLSWFNPVAAQALRWTRRALSPENRAWLAALPLVARTPGASLVHASLENPADWPYLTSTEAAAAHFDKQADRICFAGHTHVPLLFVKIGGRIVPTLLDAVRFSDAPDVKAVVNPGSVGQPRDDDPTAAYLLFDTEAEAVVPRRVAYDMAAAADKIRAAGLPPFLADRIRLGR